MTTTGTGSSAARTREGAIVVSQLDEPVDYSPMLSGRVANLVPVDDIEQGDRAR